MKDRTPARFATTGKPTHSVERVFVVISLGLLMGAVMPLLRKSAVATSGNLVEDPVQQVVLGTIYVLAALFVIRSRRRFLELLQASPEIIALLLWASMSVAWSSSIEVSFRRLVAVLGSTLFGYYVVARFGLKGAVNLLGWALALAMLCSLAIAVAAPDIAVSETGWNGIFVHKNMLGRAAALSVVTFVALSALSRRSRKLPSVLLSVLSLVLLAFSNSMTSILTASVVVVLMPLVFALRSRSFGTASMVSVVLGGVLGVLALILTNPLGSLLVVGRVGTFTGRIELWRLSLEEGFSSPVVGHGYNGFWLAWQGPSARIWESINWFPADAHNGYLNLFLDLGFVGVVIFVSIIYLALSRVVRLSTDRNSGTVLWAAAYLAFFLVYDLTETAILQPNNLTWTLFIATAAALALEHRISRSRQLSSETERVQQAGRSTHPEIPPIPWAESPPVA